MKLDNLAIVAISLVQSYKNAKPKSKSREKFKPTTDFGRLIILQLHRAKDFQKRMKKNLVNFFDKKYLQGAALAQWICLRLPFCHPGFESQAYSLCFYKFISKLRHVEKTKKQRLGLAFF